MNNDNSGVNTVLIVIVLVAVVGFMVWYFSGRTAPVDNGNDNDRDIQVDVQLPEGNGGNGENNQGGEPQGGQQPAPQQ